jgi:cytochrome c biogenesis protein CcmG/thiol:disulfide interchange protein DsbE
MSTAPDPVIAPVSRPRRGHLALFSAVAVGVVVALLVVVLHDSKPATDRVTASPLLGKAAPALSATTLDGQSFDIDSLRGKWVVLNFFATWCVPCRSEHPELRSFQERHAQAGDADVVSVVYDDSPAAVREFFQTNGGDWTVVTGDEARISLDYGVSGVPESFLIDPTGVVRYKLVGGVTSTGLDRLLTAAEGGR